MTGELRWGGRGGAGCTLQPGNTLRGRFTTVKTSGAFPDQTIRVEVTSCPGVPGRCPGPRRWMAGINVHLPRVLPGSALLKGLPAALMWRECQRGSTLRVSFQPSRRGSSRRMTPPHAGLGTGSDICSPREGRTRAAGKAPADIPGSLQREADAPDRFLASSFRLWGRPTSVIIWSISSFTCWRLQPFSLA